MPADTTPTADPPSRTLWFILGAAAGAVAGFVLGGAATGTAMEYEKVYRDRPKALPAARSRMVEGTVVSSKPIPGRPRHMGAAAKRARERRQAAA